LGVILGVKLTELKIKNAKPKDKKYKLYDGDYLYLEVYPSGNKQWVYEYKKKKVFKLGNYPTLKLKDARLKKEEIKKEIILYGLDYYVNKRLEEKQKAKRAFLSVVNEWVEVYKVGKAKRSVTTTLQRLNKHILPVFEKRDISEIKLKDIFDFLKSKERPTAEKLKSILNGIFNYAVSKEYIKHNIVKDINMSQIFGDTSKKNHYDFITDLDEVKIYYNEVNDLTTQPIVKGAIKIIWLTALRQGSVRQIKWKHIDFKNRVLIVPRDNLKIKTIDFKIYITDEMLKIFEKLKEIKASEYVFYGLKNNDEFVSETSLRKFMKSVSKKYNINYQTLHGIRHTFATLTRQYLQKKYDIKDEVIEIALQHLDKNKIREVYNHYDYFEERKELLILWEKFLKGEIKI
jgi:integrase